MYTSLYPKIINKIEGQTLLSQLKHKFANETNVIKLYNNPNKPIKKLKRKEFSSIKPKVSYNSPEKRIKNQAEKRIKGTNSNTLFNSISNRMFLTQIMKDNKHLSLNIELISSKNNKSLSVPKEQSLPHFVLKKNYSAQILSTISPLELTKQKSRNKYVNVYPTKDLDTVLKELYDTSNVKFYRKCNNSSVFKDKYASIKSRFNDIQIDLNRGHYIKERKKRSSSSSSSTRGNYIAFNSTPVLRFQKSVEYLNQYLLKDLDYKRKEKEEIEIDYISIQDNFSDMKKVLSEDVKKLKVLKKNEKHDSLLAKNLKFNKMKAKIALISKLNSNIVYQMKDSLQKKLRLEDSDIDNNKNTLRSNI